MPPNHATHVTYSGGAMAIAGGLSVHDILALCGIALAGAGFLTNLIFLWREDRRATERLAQETRDRATGDREAGDGR